MSLGYLYHRGFGEWGGWDTEPYQWLLMGSMYAPAVAHVTVAEIVADELGVTGYARLPVEGAVAVDTLTIVQGIHYGAHSPEWHGLGPGELITAVVLARQGASDADSPLVAWWEGGIPTDAGDIPFELGPWEDTGGTPLPGGDPDTRRAHSHEARTP